MIKILIVILIGFTLSFNTSMAEVKIKQPDILSDFEICSAIAWINMGSISQRKADSAKRAKNESIFEIFSMRSHIDISNYLNIEIDKEMEMLIRRSAITYVKDVYLSNKRKLTHLYYDCNAYFDYNADLWKRMFINNIDKDEAIDEFLDSRIMRHDEEGPHDTRSMYHAKEAVSLMLAFENWKETNYHLPTKTTDRTTNQTIISKMNDEEYTKFMAYVKEKKRIKNENK